MESDFEYDTAKIIYNRFRSVVSYVTDNITFHNVELIKGSKNFKIYELEEDEEEETILSFLEFSIAALLFYSMKEGACRQAVSFFFLKKKKSLF